MIETLGTNEVVWTRPETVSQPGAGGVRAADLLLRYDECAFEVVGRSQLSATANEELRFDQSSPWWQGLLVKEREVVAPTPGEGVEEAGTEIGLLHSALERASVLGQRLDLDLGRGVVGATTPAMIVASVGTFSPDLVLAGAGPYVLFEAKTGSNGDDDEWLRPDTDEALAAATLTLDEGLWEDEDDVPRALALDQLNYRGGGLMGRRRSGDGPSG